MKRLIANIILTADTENATLSEKVSYAITSLAHLAPVAFALDLVNWWFTENLQFGQFFILAIIVNMVVGAYMHLRNKTFDFKEFIFKNVEMGFVVSVIYIMLEMLRYTAGDNLAGEIFRVLIQVTALLYPTSKVFKNVFIITEGKYPPEFIMQKLYNFEKNGDLSQFFKTKDNEEIN